MAAPLIAFALLAFVPPQERPDDPLAVALDRLDAAVAAASGRSPDEASLLVSLAADVLYQPFPDEASTRDVVERVAAAARPFAARAGDESGVALEFELANCALDRGEPFLAAELLEPARARWPGDLGLAALAVEQAMQLGEWRTAAERLADAERLRSESPSGAHDPFGAGLLELERTLFELRLGRADRALPRLEALLADATLPADVRSLAVGNLVDLHLLCDRPAEAAALRERVARLGLDVEAPELALRFALARAAVTATNPDDARTALAELEGRLADRRLGATSRTLGMLRAGELALDFDEFQRAAVWLDAADARLAAARKAAPMDAGTRTARREHAMLAALRARLARRTASDDADRRRAASFALDAFDQLLEEWRATPLLPGGLSFLRSAARRSVLHEALLAALQEGGPELALGRLIEAQALGSWARRADVEPPPLAAVRRALLSSREGLLAYLPADGSSHLFAVTIDEVVHFDLPDEATIDRALSASASASTSTGGTALRDLLLPAELRTRLPEWTMVRIVGAELLGDVAFEQLLLDDGAVAATLGERIAVAYLPSIPVGVHLRERGATRAGAAGLDLALVIGPAALPDGSARFEVDETALLRPFARSRSVMLARDALARAELELPDARAAFFVAHGIVDRTRDRFCGLLLAADADGAAAIAWADAFERSRLPPLVALVACSAGEGPIRVGEDGASHLGGAALSGGASSVLLGRGALDGEANLALLVGFARALAAGAPSAEALRRARAELAREPRLARRARLELVGLGDEIVGSGPIAGAPEADDEEWRALGLAIGGVLLLLGGAWLLRASKKSRAKDAAR